MSTLVIYYSRKGQNYVNGSIEDLEKGNTKIVAEYIAKAANADLFEVETEKEYSLDYMTCTEEAKDELRANARPVLKKMLTSIEEYDNIIVAGPCWWGTYPMAIFTLLDALNFNGKNVYPVMTHEGSGLSGAPLALKRHCQGAVVGKGLAIHGADADISEEACIKWVKNNIK